MKVDVYNIEEDERFGPDLISFDHDFLLNPQKMCGSFFSDEGIQYFADLFFPNEMRKIENGLKKRITIQKIRTVSSLSDKLANTQRTINEARRLVIDKYDVGSPENSYMMMVQSHVENISAFLKYVSENSRDVFVMTHNAKPVEWNRKESSQFLFNVVSINGAEVKTMDPESQTYTGTISWSDYIERIDSTSRFIAHPIPEEVGFKNMKGFFVRDVGVNPFTGGYHFTMISEFNRAMGSYVNGILLKV